MLVVLRLSIGAHFLYEGAWKIAHRQEFSARPFLTQAKGPAAEFFYAMVPDLDGRERLRIENDEDGEKVVRAGAYLGPWNDLRQDVIAHYALDEKQTAAAKKLYERYARSAQDYLSGNRDEILAHFGSLDRFEARQAQGNNGAQFQKKRAWDTRQDLRREVNVWLNELDGMGEDYRMALWDLLTPGQQAKGMVSAAVPETDALPLSLPFVNSRTELLNLSVTYGLTAIGLCLVLGFCSRLACLGGAAFLISVLLTQPPWPAIYPPAPAVVGHALVIDKNFVEMVGLLLLATTAVGRWGGLDYFLHRWVARLFVSAGGEEKEEQKAQKA